MTNKNFPTVLKYIHDSGEKRLFISMPENLDPTTFLKEYRNAISQIHQEFYKKKSVLSKLSGVSEVAYWNY